MIGSAFSPPCIPCEILANISTYLSGIRITQTLSALPLLFVAWAITVILELGFFFLTGKRNKDDALLVLLVNTLTNPVVVFSCWVAVICVNIHYAAVVIPLELLAILCEGFIYKRKGDNFRRPYLFSACANAFSFGTGLLLQLMEVI